MEKITLYINGQEIQATPDQTILEVVKNNGIDAIPTLCHDERLAPYGSCFLCVVEVEGIGRLLPSCATKVAPGMKVTTNNERITASRRTALELLLSNHYADCIGPCINNCPANVDAQGYIALISKGQFDEALQLIKQTNPLPLSIGRVCVRDCENACRRAIIDEAVNINSLKRYVADLDAPHKWKPEIAPKKNKSVAVVGGGPSGLTCAYYLTINGYSVAILEKEKELGGMMKWGIPEYRLPKKVLNDEIDWITDLGIKVETGVEVGKDTTIADLKNKYDAVYIAAGAQGAMAMGLNCEKDAKCVFNGIEFLGNVQKNGVPEYLKGKTVVVVGGGNTAIDASRTALRCGAKVKLVYRRSVKEMPAHHTEVEAAEHEGVEFNFLTNPITLEFECDTFKGLKCTKMKLEAKPGERPVPVPVEGSEHVIECDYIIGAIGQHVDKSFIKSIEAIKLGKSGVVAVDKNTFETSIPGVFAGGDVVNGPWSAISAIADGKNAALTIAGFLETGKARKMPFKFYSFKHNFNEVPVTEFIEYYKASRAVMPEIDAKKRVKNFDEVETGLSDSQSICETGRCLECGCVEYYDCQLRKYCDVYNVDIARVTGGLRKDVVDNRHPYIVLDANKCINCGRCIRTCGEVLKISALSFVYRGFKSVMKPAMEKALIETTCVSCGNCIDVCPTGAIAIKFPYKILGTLKKENIDSICNFCSVGCNVNFKHVNDETFYPANTTTRSVKSHNNGYLCVKGRFGARFYSEQGRISSPMIGKKAVTFDEAVTETGKKLNDIVKKYGNDSVAIFASPKLSNEELFSLQKLARSGLDSGMVASLSSLLNNADENTLDKILGITSSTADTDDFVNAEVIVVANCNIEEENFVMEIKIKQAVDSGAKLVVIGSAPNRLAEKADLFVKIKPGAIPALFNFTSKSTVDSGKYNTDFIANKTENFIAFKSMVDEFSMDRTVKASSADSESLGTLIKILSNTKNAVVVYNPDCLTDKSPEDIKSIANYMLLTGRISDEGNGIILLRDYANSAGVAAMGMTSGYLPGYIITSGADVKSALQQGKIKAAVIVGEDPFADKDAAKYFSKIDLIVAADIYPTETTKKADIVFPLATAAESEGTYISCDGRIQKSAPVRKNVNIASNLKFISNLAASTGKVSTGDSSEKVSAEIKATVDCYKMEDGSFVKKLFKDKFRTKSGKAVFSVFKAGAELTDKKKHIIIASENYFNNSIKSKLMN